MADYLAEGAVLKCSNGTRNSKLVVTSQNSVYTGDKLLASIQDCAFLPFGECRNNPLKICAPECDGWNGGKKNVLVAGSYALMDRDTAFCTSGGGTITVDNSGQYKL